MSAVGLRELKKNRTRQLIADAASELFRARGFDAVTVDEIAAAAQVSKKTVFNHFPTKEDLVFYRAEDREAMSLAAVTGRPAGLSVLDSFRAMCLAQTRLIPGMRRDLVQPRSFYDLVSSNPSLERKMHEVNERIIQVLTDALAAEAGAEPGDPLPRVVASALVGAQRALYRRLRQRVREGGSDEEIGRAHRADVERVFDLLGKGLGGYPPG